jgi:hypothetical protein
VEFVEHVTDDTLERYAMESLRGSESEPLEEHLLVCSECQERLDAELEFVAAMTSAAAKIRDGEGDPAIDCDSEIRSRVHDRSGHENE